MRGADLQDKSTTTYFLLGVASNFYSSSPGKLTQQNPGTLHARSRPRVWRALARGAACLVMGERSAFGPAQRSLSLVLAAIYGSFMFCRMYFSIASDAIRKDSDIQMGTADATMIIVVSGVAFGVAKVLTGMVVDAMQARTALYLSMALTAGLVFLFSSASSYSEMMIISAVNALPQASGYPIVAKIGYEGLSKEHLSVFFAYISIGSRLGSVFASLVLGRGLASLSWRNAVRLAPLAVISAMIIFALFEFVRGGGSSSAGKKRPDSQKKEQKDAKQQEGESFASVFRRIAKSSQFWSVNLASSFLLASKAFEAYCAMYLGDVIDISSSTAAMTVSAIPAGIVTSVIFGNLVIDPLPIKRKAAATVRLCALNLFSLISLGGITWALETGVLSAPPGGVGWVLVALAVLLFTMGFGAGYCFYIPQSLFAVNFGKDKSATVVGCGELIQAVIAASFALGGGYVAENFGWRFVWGILSVAGCGSVYFMNGFFAKHLQDLKEKTE